MSGVAVNEWDAGAQRFTIRYVPEDAQEVSVSRALWESLASDVAAVRRVKAFHAPYDDPERPFGILTLCRGCTVPGEYYVTSWPCDTIKVLNGEEVHTLWDYE